LSRQKLAETAIDQAHIFKCCRAFFRGRKNRYYTIEKHFYFVVFHKKINRRYNRKNYKKYSRKEILRKTKPAAPVKLKVRPRFCFYKRGYNFVYAELVGVRNFLCKMDTLFNVARHKFYEQHSVIVYHRNKSAQTENKQKYHCYAGYDYAYGSCEFVYVSQFPRVSCIFYGAFQKRDGNIYTVSNHKTQYKRADNSDNSAESLGKRAEFKHNFIRQHNADHQKEYAQISFGVNKRAQEPEPFGGFGFSIVAVAVACRFDFFLLVFAHKFVRPT
jgi:hypothetical protein